jgi:hypothetical protein
VKVTVGWLSYITEKNFKYRFEDFSKSLNSLEIFKRKDIEFISIDNSSIEAAVSKIKQSCVFDTFYHYQKNYFDVSLFYTTLWHAELSNSEYTCFMYDDFIAYDDAFEDVIKFMDDNPHVSCTRIAYYDFQAKSKFDSKITPKYINPDSVRHYNTVTNQSLSWSDPINVGKHRFFINNWHYTSRPMIWRTSFLLKMLKSQEEKSKVLQGFEGWASKIAESQGLVTGVLDGGMVKTTHVENSARTIELGHSDEISIKISISELRQDFNKFTE